MSVTVRRARASDYDAIARFIELAYDDLAQYKGADRWRWQFLDTPFRAAPDSDPTVWISLDDGSVVGAIGVQETEVYLAGRILRGGWIVDVMILESHRGQGLGHTLHDAVAAEVPILLTLTMAVATRRMAERAGCVTLGPVRLFVRWGRLRPATIRRYLSARTEHRHNIHAVATALCRYARLHRLLSWAINPALWVRDLIARSSPVRGLEIEEVSRFNDETDTLWERLCDESQGVCPRTSEFLNWRFVDCPGLTYRRFIARRDGQIVGYIVTRICAPVELPVGVIVDLFTSKSDTDAIRGLLDHAMGTAGDDVDAWLCATSADEYAHTLRSLGFFTHQVKHPTCVCSDDDVRERVRESAQDWFFTKGDHDWDQIHLS